MGYTAVQTNTTGTIAYSLPVRFNTSVQLAAGAFTASESYSVTKILANIKRYGSPSGSIFVSIYATTGSVGQPTGSALGTSDGVTINAVSTSGENKEFVFSTPVSLTNGVTYAMVFSGNWTTSATNYARPASIPKTGVNLFYGNGSGTWTQDATNYNMYYITYKTVADATPNDAIAFGPGI
jgi:hypothetical protein